MKARLENIGPPPAARNRVSHQHGDGHGAYAAGHGGDGGAFGGDFFKGYVAYQAVAAGGRGVVFAVDSDVDDDGSFSHEVGFYELGLTDCGDEDVGGATDFSEVATSGVRDCDGGVAAQSFSHKEQG